jgi:RNA polymerase sigma-70 factor (ECF subfamily)
MNNRNDHIINEELARRYQAGDREALKELIKRFNSSLNLKVYTHTRDKDSLNDIVQDCWYVIINNLEEIKFQVGFEAWALNIARNKAIDWIRSQQVRRKTFKSIRQEERVNFIEADDERELKIQEMKACMSKLPESQKIILELFYKENLTLAEISEALGISRGTVKSRLFTAREQLKKLIH